MKRFLSYMKHIAPWLLFVLGSILLAVSVFLKFPPGIFLFGIVLFCLVFLFVFNCIMVRETKKELARRLKLEITSGRAKLTPSLGGKYCVGNGQFPGLECCCDECDHYLTCFPDKREPI